MMTRILNLIVFLLLITNSYARHIAHIDEEELNSNPDQPKVERSSTAPSSGAYFKTDPYHVTVTSSDPYSEEILFFLLTKKTGKLTGANAYLKFHTYFKKEYDKLLRDNSNNPGYVVGPKDLYPLVKSYFSKQGISISDSEFSLFLSETEDVMKKIKFIFATKANATYYIVSPESAEARLDKSGKFPTIIARNGNYRIRKMIITSNLTHFQNKAEEKSLQIQKAREIRDELQHIYDSLPSKRTSVKAHIKKYLDKI